MAERASGAARRAARLSAILALVPVALGAAVVGVVGVLGPVPAEAAAIEVTSTDDDALTPGTLRWAIDQAEADATDPVITLAPGLEIDLTCAGGGALAYDHPAGRPLTLEGGGGTVRQTCPATPVLTTVEDLTVSDATITGGTDGAITAQQDVTLDRVVVEGNTDAAGGQAAAVNAFTGTVTVTESTVVDNQGGIGGGLAGVHVVVDRSTLAGNQGSTGGGLWADQTATVTNSTITANQVTGRGGGVTSTNSDITLAFVTVVDNTAGTGGANVAMVTSGDLVSYGTIIAQPQGAANCDLNAGVGTVSQGSNAVDDGSCGLEALATDPVLGPLADNGGPTATLLPGAGSPLLDTADCAAAPVGIDQRGVVRPQGGACDIGAVEVEPDVSTTTTTTTVPTSTTAVTSSTAPGGSTTVAGGTSTVAGGGPAGSGGSGATGPAGGGAPSGPLPRTGPPDNGALALLGVGLLAVGGVLVATGRRHRLRPTTP